MREKRTGSDGPGIKNTEKGDRGSLGRGNESLNAFQNKPGKGWKTTAWSNEQGPFERKEKECMGASCIFSKNHCT